MQQHRAVITAHQFPGTIPTERGSVSGIGCGAKAPAGLRAHWQRTPSPGRPARWRPRPRPSGTWCRDDAPSTARGCACCTACSLPPESVWCAQPAGSTSGLPGRKDHSIKGMHSFTVTLVFLARKLHLHNCLAGQGRPCSGHLQLHIRVVTLPAGGRQLCPRL